MAIKGKCTIPENNFFLKDTCTGNALSWIMGALALRDKSSYRQSTEKLD